MGLLPVYLPHNAGIFIVDCNIIYAIPTSELYASYELCIHNIPTYVVALLLPRGILYGCRVMISFDAMFSD